MVEAGNACGAVYTCADIRTTFQSFFTSTLERIRQQLRNHTSCTKTCPTHDAERSPQRLLQDVHPPV